MLRSGPERISVGCCRSYGLGPRLYSTFAGFANLNFENISALSAIDVNAVEVCGFPVAWIVDPN